MPTEANKSLGQAIDEIVKALQGLEDSSRSTAIKAACEHLGIPFAGIMTPSFTAQVEKVGVPISPENYTSPPQPHPPSDIRSLKGQKSPANSLEMACVVAYYLQYVVPDAERKAEISTDDLDNYFRQADFPISKRLDNVLVKAKAAGYFDSTGRGTYKLNAVGYNLVVHSLPRSTKSTNPVISRQKSRRSKSKKATKKTIRSK